MDRFKLFHAILTHCDITVISSVLSAMLDQISRGFGVERGFYLSAAGGSMRCLAARTETGNEIPNAMSHVPAEIIQRVVQSREPFAAKMPIIQKGHATTSSFGGVQIRTMLALPSIQERQLVGITYMERRSSFPAFNQREIDTISALVQDVEQLIENSRKYQKNVYEIDHLKSEITRTKINMISEHPSMLRLFKQIEKLARVPSTVLIQGESGTGKELVARAIYNLSGQKGSFISINCGAIEPNLMKSELFGHVKGSFTGAMKDRDGLFKKAEGGILFMDEIGEMPMDMQVALLRTLELGEILPVGSERPEIVNTRVIAATHRDLLEMVEEKSFRNDLYQRLKGISLRVPSLRERSSDIPLLADFFLKKFNNELNCSYRGFSDEGMQQLTQNSFDAGNVRELKHLIEKAMVFEEDDDWIGPEFLKSEAGPNQPILQSDQSFESLMSHYAKRIIEEAIELEGGNKTQAMNRLGVPRTTFYSMLNRYGIALEGGGS